MCIGEFITLDISFIIINIQNAFTTKMREKQSNPRKNLLDYSIDKYGAGLIADIRCLSRILLLYLPVPLFWTLYDQKGSRWTIQVGFFVNIFFHLEYKIGNISIVFSLP